MVKVISVLGSTGSIGRQTLEAAQRLGIRVAALTANSNIELLEQQVRQFRPAFAAVFDEGAALALSRSLEGEGVTIGRGLSGLLEAAAIDGADTVVTALSGSVGLYPTLAAIDAGRRIALANKETLVCAGELVMKRAAEAGAEIIPVDSEHSAVFQCLEGRRADVKRIILTASGGPFRGKTLAETADVTPTDALRHPNWSMGAKISIDSATMMNKGLEIIEAMHLFGVSADGISVLIHPESIIHSMVEMKDGAVLAQLGVPDMRLPIQYALTYPERRDSGFNAPDLAALGKLTFESPSLENTPCLRLAMDCARRGGTAPAIMSAANEEAVSLFLRGIIGFNNIYECAAFALDSIEIGDAADLGDILQADAEARRRVRAKYIAI